MKARFSFLSAAILSFSLCAPAGAGTAQVFEEGFSDFNYVWTSTADGAKIGTSAPATFNADSNGWTGSLVIKGKSGMRLGQASSYGYIVSPPISLSGKGTTTVLDVSFYIAAQNANAVNKGTLTVSVEGTDLVSSGYTVTSSEPASNTSYILSTNDVLKKTWTISDVSSLPDPFQLRFATSVDGRVCIDQIVVTETYSSGIPKLATPTNLLAPSTNYFGFALSWDSVVDATNGYTVTLSPAEGNSGVTVSGTTATMTGLTEGATYDVSVVAKGDGTGTDDSEAATLLGVKTLTAPPVSEPDLMYTVSASALTVSWPAQNDASFSVLAWTNKPVNAANENFAKYAADGTVPDGWLFENGRNHYTWSDAPVDFRASGSSQVDQWIGTPEFGGPVSKVSFHLRKVSAVTGTFKVYGSTGSTNQADWVEIKTLTNGEIDTGDYSIEEFENGDSLAEAGFTRLFFRAVKSAGAFAFGTFSVTGTGVGKEPVYLTGYGPSPTDVNTTSVTFANPVVGETYYVEVTATGLSGRTESKTISVPVPAASYPAVISVK